MSKQTAFDLMAAKLEEAKRASMDALNRELFANITAVPVAPVPRKWTTRAWWRIRGYLSTLWLALKGRELVEQDDWDY